MPETWNDLKVYCELHKGDTITGLHADTKNDVLYAFTETGIYAIIERFPIKIWTKETY